MKLTRRKLFAGLAGAVSAPILATVANAAPHCYSGNKNSVQWTVPTDIKRIRVHSWDKDGNDLIDTHFSVKPEQVFKIDVAT
jgi:hypothetical protein